MNDPNHGHGGSYLIDQETGARQLVARTQSAPPMPQPAATTEPAQAGFFTPVDPAPPAETPTITEHE